MSIDLLENSPDQEALLEECLSTYNPFRIFANRDRLLEFVNKVYSETDQCNDLIDEQIPKFRSCVDKIDQVRILHDLVRSIKIKLSQ